MLLHAFCFVDRINLWNAARHMIGNPSLWHFAFFINTKQGDCSEWSIIILSWKTECLNYSREIKLLLQSGSRRGDLGACLFMVNNAWWHPDETMNQHLSDSAHNWCTKCIGPQLPTYVSENNGKFWKGNRGFANSQCCQM